VKHIETFNGGTHNDTWTRYGYYDHINKFIKYVSNGGHTVSRRVQCKKKECSPLLDFLFFVVVALSIPFIASATTCAKNKNYFLAVGTVTED